MNSTMRWLLTACLSLGLVASAMAQDRGTKDEAKALDDAAIAHIKKVGAEQAYKDFSTDKTNWTKKDLYVMVYDGKGNCVAHGANEKLVGKDMSMVKDAKGVAIVPAMIAAAAKGGGWVDYDWPHPVTKKIEAKSTFAQKPPSGDGFVGVGIYR